MPHNPVPIWLARFALIGVFIPAQVLATSLEPTVVEPQLESDWMSAALEVDVSQLQGADDLTWKHIHTNVTKELVDRYRVPVVEDDAESILRLHLSYDDEQSATVRIKIEVVRGDAVESLQDVVCELCATDPEITRKIVATLPEIVPHLAKKRPETLPKHVAEAPSPPSQQDPEKPEAKRVGVAGGFGIAAMPLGLAAMITGSVFLARDGDVEVYDNLQQTRERAVPGGPILVTSGVLGVALGVSLILADQLHFRPKREGTSRRSRAVLRLVPSMDSHRFAATICGRF